MSVDVEHSTHPLNETQVRIHGAMMKERERGRLLYIAENSLRDLIIAWCTNG